MSRETFRPGVRFDQVTKRWGHLVALDDLSLSFPAGKLTAVTGASGAGKSTLLRLAAGLLKPDQGTISSTDSDDRPHTVLVFQDNLLFPHLRVIDNVMFAPLARKRPRAEAHSKALGLLDRVGLKDKATSWPAELSAGQQQRVALARALAADPEVLLLDEPFANLDRSLRLETARFVRGLQKDQSLTVALVTHGQEEAFTVADHVVLLDQGRLLQEGPADEFRTSPRSLLVAQFTGEVNVVMVQGQRVAFRAGDTTFVEDDQGEAVVTHVEWTGQAFRALATWAGQEVASLTSTQPPPPTTRVRVVYTPLRFQEKL